jgi:signal transduction histidine kinase
MREKELLVELPLPANDQILDALSIGVVVLNDGVIRFISRGAEELLGVDTLMVVGRRVDMLPLRSVAYRVLSENSRDEPIHVSADHRYMRVFTHTYDGDHAGVEVVELHDLTRERREIRQREEFVAMLTHDLKSPLTVMMGYIQALYGAPSPELIAQCVPELDRSAKRLRGMVEDILDAYRMEVGLLQTAMGPCALGEILEECCSELVHEAAQQGVTLSWQLPDSFPSLVADANQLSRVFANLIVNAIKFTPRGGSVRIAIEQTPRTIAVAITDTGIGIPPDELTKVFLKYFRSRKSAGYKGTGLGLAISKAFVEANGGTISLASAEGVGTTVTVTLPIFAEECCHLSL